MSDPRNGQIHWLKLWVQRTRGDTAHLTPAALGAYIRLLLEQIRRQERIPDDPKLLRTITGIRSGWPAIHAELLTVLEQRDGVLTNPFAEEYIAEFRARSQRNRENIAKRYRVITGGVEDAEDVI